MIPKNILLLLTGLCAALPSVCFGQNENPKIDARYRLVVNVSHQTMQDLVANQTMTAEVPDSYLGKIASIKIVYVDTIIERPHKTQAISKQGRNELKLSLDHVDLDRLKFQPLVVDSPASSFSSIRLNFKQPESNEEVESDDDIEQTKTTSESSAFVRLSRGRMIEGELASLSLTLNTDFGEIQLSGSAIKAARFSLDANNRCVVLLKNGNRISGNLQNPSLQFTTFWGHADIGSQQIVSITPTQSMRFSTRNGRVQLVDENESLASN